MRDAIENVISIVCLVVGFSLAATSFTVPTDLHRMSINNWFDETKLQAENHIGASVKMDLAYKDVESCAIDKAIGKGIVGKSVFTYLAQSDEALVRSIKDTASDCVNKRIGSTAKYHDKLAFIETVEFYRSIGLPVSNEYQSRISGRGF